MGMSLSRLWELVMDREAGGLQSTGSQRVGHDWATEQQQQFICCSLFKIQLFGTEWTVWSENWVSESCLSYGDCCHIFGSGIAVWGCLRVSEVKRTVLDFSACPVVRTLSFQIKGMTAQVWPLDREVRSHVPHLYYWKICYWRILVASKPNLWWQQG